MASRLEREVLASSGIYNAYAMRSTSNKTIYYNYLVEFRQVVSDYLGEWGTSLIEPPLMRVQPSSTTYAAHGLYPHLSPDNGSHL